MTTNSILDSYLQFRRALTALRTKEARDVEFGQSQTMVLYRLAQSDATMGELVEHAMTDKAAMSRTVSSLLKAGLVRRKADPADRRVVRIELTAKGRTKARLATKIRANIGKALENSLSAKDRRTFVELMDQITAYLNAHS